MTDKQIEDAVFAVLRRWKDDRAWERYTRESGPYDVTILRPEVLEIIRAVLAEAERDLAYYKNIAERCTDRALKTAGASGPLGDPEVTG